MSDRKLTIMRTRPNGRPEYCTTSWHCPADLRTYLNERHLLDHQNGQNYVRDRWWFTSDEDELEFLLLYSEAVFDA